MVYKYLNSEKIDSDNCSDWESLFRVCMQQPRKESSVFIPVNGELVLNQVTLDKVETNTDWNIVRPKQPATSNKIPLVHLSGMAKPIENGEQIFLVKDKRYLKDSSWLHQSPGYVVTAFDIWVFDNYKIAIAYANTRMVECSIWQLSKAKFELLHDFGYLESW